MGSRAITVGEQKFDAKTHAPVLIYPNPLNPEKYVVLNSSFTYREYDYLNNARQVPKLPDWAVIDLTTPPDARWPGRSQRGFLRGEVGVEDRQVAQERYGVSLPSLRRSLRLTVRHEGHQCR